MQLKNSYILCFFSFSLLNAFGQDKNFVKGKIINIGNNKQFSVLMRDTTLGGNRFDSRFDSGIKNNISTNSADKMLPAFVIDSALAVKCEKVLQSNDSERVSFYDYSKEDIVNKQSKYIHLFMGYIDEKNQLKVVVQFVTPKEFKRDKKIYDKELFLLALQKNLRFAILKIPTLKGTKTSGSARSQLAKDIKDLRNNTNAPNSSFQSLIELSKQLYPQSYIKPPKSN